MKNRPVSLRTRFAISVPSCSAAPSILDGPLYPAKANRRARLTLPALALVAGAAILTTTPSMRAANAPDPVLGTATDLGVNTAGTTYTATATTTSDVEFLAATTYNSTLGLSAALSIGTLDDFNASAIAINGSGLLTLNTAANSVAPNAADLLYVTGGGNLSIQTTGGITFAATGNVDDAGTLSLGTSPVTITAGTTLSFLGAGTTTVGGNIVNTTGNVAINDAGGSVTFTGTNAYTGTTMIYNGALLSADATGAIGTGVITLNPGATLRTLSTAGGSLGGGAFTLNTSTIQVGSSTVANASATLPGALSLIGGTSYINLQDGGGTSTLKFTSTTTPARSLSGTNFAATLIVNGATALNGTTDVLNFGTAAGANAAAPNFIMNGIFPAYEVGTVGGTSNASFLTTTTGAVGGNVTLFTAPVANQYNNNAAATFSGSNIYSLSGANTITSGQTAYALQFNSGATLATGTNTLQVNPNSSQVAGIIFNGTGDAITGATLNVSSAELDIYTGGSATISTNITSGSGGPFLTTFGPGTLTLSGASVADTNSGGQGFTVNGGAGGVGGNVIINAGNIAINQVTVNGGALTLGTANVFTNPSGIASTNLTVNTLGTVNLQGNSELIGNLNGGSSALILGGTITNSTGSATLSLNNASGSYYGAITNASGDPLGVTKYGNNTQNLQGTLSYTGTTTVNGGQLTFAPAVAGVNDSVGTLSFAQGLGTVQSNYQGTGTTTLTFSNLAARTAGAEANFATSGGTNGTTNKIVVTNFAGAAPTAGTLLDRGYFFGGNNYATVDAGGFLRAYTATDANGANAAAGTSIASSPTSNVFVNGNQSAQTTASFNTVNLTGSNAITLAAGQTLSTNGVLSNGIAQITGGTGLTTTTAGAELVVRSNANQLSLTTPILDNGGTALTTSGSVILQGANTYTGVTTVDAGTLYLGNQSGTGLATGSLGSSSGVVLNSGGNLTFNRSNAYSFTNGITTGTFAGGSTITQAGAGALTLGSITNTGNTNTLAVTRNVSTGALTLGTLNGNINLTDNSTNGATAPTTVTQTGTGLTINQIAGASGSVVNLNGTGTTGITAVLNTVGQTVNFNGGTFNLNGSGAYQTTMVVNGATINTLSSASNSTNFYDVLNLQVLSGTFNDQLFNGIRFGSNSGSNSTGGASSSTGVLSGGTINFTNGGNGGLNLGNSATTTAYTNVFTQSGGTLNGVAGGNAINIGAGVSGGGISSYNFSGGTLLLNGTIAGSQGTGAEQSFVWTGGTLSTSAYNATNLTSTQGTAVSATTNTLTNAGTGILAPGGVGTAGLTTITGNYAVTSGNASYAVDLGSTTQATGFQTGGYDLTNVTLTAALGGKLNASLIGGFLTTAPTNASTFTILQTGTGTKTAGSLSGTFTNTEIGKTLPVIALTGGGATGLNSFSVTYNAGTTTADGSVVLGNYSATNTYTGATGSNWDATAAANWSVFDPGSTTAPATVASGAVAQFADNAGTGTGANTVLLNSTRNIQGIQFASAVSGHNYTINDAGNGTGAIILDNTANAAAATIADSSAAGNANVINVPIALRSPLNVSVTNAGTSLTLGGAVTNATAQAVTVNSGTGNAGALLINGSLGSAGTPAGVLTVNAGTLGGTGILTVASATVSAAGTLAPGMTIGATTGALTLNTTSGLALNGTLQIGITATGGTTLTTTGALTLGGTSILTVTGTSGAQSYDLANYGTETGTFATANIPGGYTVDYGTVTPGEITLDMTAVPEPSTWTGALLIILSAVGIKLRRRKAQVG